MIWLKLNWLTTKIPDLKEWEKVYFHYIIATNTIRKSTDYPYKNHVSAWYAVDKYKLGIEN